MRAIEGGVQKVTTHANANANAIWDVNKVPSPESGAHER
jgi:hypothetical protein